jgi:hypothetical protein
VTFPVHAVPIAPAAVATASRLAPASGAAPCGPSFGALLEARASHGALAPTSPNPGPPRLGEVASRALEGIEGAQARLDGLLAAARTGRTFTAQELMVLQGQAYRFSQTVQLSAKLVEQGAQAVRHALNAQV